MTLGELREYVEKQIAEHEGAKREGYRRALGAWYCAGNNAVKIEEDLSKKRDIARDAFTRAYYADRGELGIIDGVLTDVIRQLRLTEDYAEEYYDKMTKDEKRVYTYVLKESGISIDWRRADAESIAVANMPRWISAVNAIGCVPSWRRRSVAIKFF